MTSSTLDDAICFFDWGLIYEAWILGITWLQKASLWLLTGYREKKQVNKMITFGIQCLFETAYVTLSLSFIYKQHTCGHGMSRQTYMHGMSSLLTHQDEGSYRNEKECNEDDERWRENSNTNRKVSEIRKRGTNELIHTFHKVIWLPQMVNVEVQ